MIRRTAIAVLLAGICAAAGGCGSSHAGAPSGRAVFASACSACHSLTGTENPRKQGGDLLAFHISHADLLQYAREMPVIHHPLSDAELQAVVSYVQAAERAGR